MPFGKIGSAVIAAKSVPPLKSDQLPVVGYARVSTVEQASQGVSLDAQAQRIRGYCAGLGLELVELVEDAGESASSLERPGLSRALEVLGQGRAAGLVVVKLDRLTRSVADLDRLLSGPFRPSGGAQLLSVGDSIDTRTAAGRFALNLLMSVAQWERETIVERTREALAFKRARGEPTGVIPYGSRLGPDGRLEPDPGELATIAAAVAMRRDGVSFRRIADRLDQLGHKPRGGGRWSLGTLGRLLARELLSCAPRS